MIIIANKKPAQEHAAVWVPDGDASTCMHCLKIKFTPINRRVIKKHNTQALLAGWLAGRPIKLLVYLFISIAPLS